LNGIHSQSKGFLAFINGRLWILTVISITGNKNYPKEKFLKHLNFTS